MAKVSLKNAGIAGVLFFLSFVVACYAWIPFVLKLLVDVFATKLPFWASFWFNLGGFILTEIIAIICMALFAGIAAVSATRKK